MKPRRVRGAVRYATLALVVAGLAVGAGSASASKSDVVTINFESVNTVQNAWKGIIDDFQVKYPNIHVNATYLDSVSASTLLPTQLQAGNAPDIFTASAGTGSSTSIWPLAQAGKLLDLSGLPLVKSIPKSGLAVHSYQGKVYGFPMAVSTNGVFYNTDLFKQLKLTPPTNLSDFFALCRKIKADGKIPIALGTAGSTVGVSVLLLQLENEFVYAQDGNWVNKLIAGKVNFSSSPLWRAMFQTIANLSKDGCFNSQPAGTSYPTGAANLVASGQAVMEFLSGGTINSVTSINPNIHYAMFELPPDNSSGKHTYASIGYNLSYAANAATKHPAEVKTFLSFAAGADEDYRWATLASSVAPLNLVKGLWPSYLADSDRVLAKAGRVSLNQSILLPKTSVNTVLTNDIIGLLTGQETVSSALAALDKAWKS
jgi:raffinose/stachyose/melibiose transport system substrate-binding protein